MTMYLCILSIALASSVKLYRTSTYVVVVERYVKVSVTLNEIRVPSPSRR